MSLIENARRMISVDSTPGQGSLEAALVAAELCRSAGFDVQVEEEVRHGITQANICARREAQGGAQSEPLYFQSHLDTTDPGAFSAWTQTQNNPFSAAISDGELYGLGSSSGKIDFLCQLEAAAQYKDRALTKRPLVLMGTYGANDGMSGALRAVRKKMLLSSAPIVVGGPTSLYLSRDGMGEAYFEVRVPFGEEEQHYRSTHDLQESASTQSKVFLDRGASAHWTLNENPIVRAIDYLQQLPSGIALMELDSGVERGTWPASAVLELDVVGRIQSAAVPVLIGLGQLLRESEQELITKWSKQESYSPIHIGLARTDSEGIRIGGFVRLSPDLPKGQIEEWLEGVRGECMSLGADFRIADYKPGFCTPEESGFYKTCLSIVRQSEISAGQVQFMGSSEGNIFGRFGMECVVFGPGSNPRAGRSPNEKVRIKDAERAVEFYAQLVERMCL